MYAYRRCRGPAAQAQRIARTIMAGNLFFSAAWAVPWHHGITFPALQFGAA